MRPNYLLCVLAVAISISCGGPDVSSQQPVQAGASAAALTSVGAMGVARESHTATLLQNGKVLVVGGLTASGGGASTALQSAELYDPVAKTWSGTDAMTTPRADHTATLLPNGKVLVVGGDDTSTAFPSAELYDPQAGTWSPVASMATPREFHTATLLATGKVLVAGGDGGGIIPVTLDTAELYDPQANAWSFTAAAMPGPRNSHTAVLLPSGKVLVAGGKDGTNANALLSAALYDPAASTWLATTGPMQAGRVEHTATLLQTGKVLVAGGSDGVSLNALASSELYDPATGLWTLTTGPLSGNRDAHTATLLPNGSVLVASGKSATSVTTAVLTAEQYDPAAGTWSAADALATARVFHTATRLLSGAVLITGGFGGGVPLASSELYVASATALAISAPTATVGPKGTLTFTATGGTGFGYTWSISPNPSGGSITSAGVYTAGSKGGVTDVIVVTDSAGATASQNVVVTGSSSSGGCASSGSGGWLSVVAALAAAAVFRRRAQPVQRAS